MLSERWWHAYGGAGGMGWVMTIAGDCPTHPEEQAPSKPQIEVELWNEPYVLRYLRSWDHEPSDAEKAAVTPLEYQDD